MTDAQGRSRSALHDFARERGRSAFVVVDLQDGQEWSGGVAQDETRPAASLLKVVVAMACELGGVDGSAGRVGDLLEDSDTATTLRLLDPEREITSAEALRLAVGSSDGPCARWLWRQVHAPQVQAVLDEVGCARTAFGPEEDGRYLRGTTTAAEAVRILRGAFDCGRFPLTASALSSSTLNSRIPLGALDTDVAIAHKTGTLPGVANDVARLHCDLGTVWAAFLSEHQHDMLVTGYEMGICTRSILTAWGMSVRRTTSALSVLG